MVTDLIIFAGKAAEAARNALLALGFIGLPLGACALVDYMVPANDNSLPPTYNNCEQ